VEKPVYALIDRPIAELPAADRFLLDAMRAWVHALTLAGDPGSVIANGFASQGRAGEAAAFDAAMRVLDTGSTATITFQRPCHATVEEDEAVVLSLWQLVRDDRLSGATAAARLLVAPAQAGALIRAMMAAIVD
jgi:hypothetical protein